MRFLLVETAAPFLGKTIEFAGNVLTLPRKYEGEVIKYFSLPGKFISATLKYGYSPFSCKSSLVGVYPLLTAQTSPSRLYSQLCFMADDHFAEFGHSLEKTLFKRVKSIHNYFRSIIDYSLTDNLLICVER